MVFVVTEVIFDLGSGANLIGWLLMFVQALAIIIEHFGISFDSESFLSRCGKCNGSRLAMIDKRELKDDPRVAPKVRQYFAVLRFEYSSITTLHDLDRYMQE